MTAPTPAPHSAAGPALPVVQRHTDEAVGTPGPRDGDTKGTSRSTPNNPAGAPANAPHRRPGTGRSGARTRGGLGEPLSALPPSANLPGSAASGANASRTAPGPNASRKAPGPNVQRAGPHHPEPEGTEGTARADGAAHTKPTANAEGPAGKARQPGMTSGKPDSGRRRADGPVPPGPVAPSPVVIARAVAEGSGGVRRISVAAPLLRTANRSGAHRAPAAPRTLSLLAARPLTLNTRAPEGVAPHAGARSGGRPVVAARWPGAPGTPQEDPATPSGPAPRPTPGPSSATPATPQRQPQPQPQIQRAVSAPPVPSDSGVDNSGDPRSVQRVPVVRPAAPDRATPTGVAQATAVPGRTLPVTALQTPAPQTSALMDRPSAAPVPVNPVPVVRPRPATPNPGPAPGPRAAASGAPPVQRTVRGTGGASAPTGASATTGPARGRPRSASEPSAPGKGTAHRAETPQDPGVDLDDLARRLLDPVARLLRTELRRGRERTGRPYDGRR
ncbi:hypothetical protein [Streptomyces sp. 7N604]|uniref:hypothetical protein n=1 Tax=Streptomyces sp. 7N604 TaxID=3457415 RepID=UPI003FD504B5